MGLRKAAGGNTGTKNDPLDAQFIGGLKYVPGSLDIYMDIVFRFCLVIEIDCGKMNDRIGASELFAQCIEVQNIRLSKVHILPGRAKIENFYREILVELFDHIVSKSSAAAGNYDSMGLWAGSFTHCISPAQMLLDL
ncbi:hypothetical protein H681_14500 [Pseudomonas sp. ATCC 13867]|nr:hypothetical protein H681_14500 [Pseudomonas sp. ATCC 13867]